MSYKDKTNQEYFAKYYKDNRDKFVKRSKELDPLVRRKHKLWTYYRMRQEDYDALMVKQSGKCKICSRTSDQVPGFHKQKYLVVDHCHKTGRVRGLLCHLCNRALGLIKENTDTLDRAAAYLEKHHAKR